MAAISTIVMGVAAAATAYTAYEGRKDAKENMRRAADAQRKAQDEQKALNAAQMAQERRQQIREERVRRARIIQASANSGTTGSSGEFGALSSLSTQLSNNLGINAGRAAAGNRISNFMQNAADYNLAGQESLFRAQNADSLFGMTMNLYGAGGFSAFQSTPDVQPLNTTTPVAVGDAYWKS